MLLSEQMLLEASQKRDLAKQLRNQSNRLALESLRLRVVKQAESLEEEATVLEAAARARKKMLRRQWSRLPPRLSLLWEHLSPGSGGKRP